MDLSNITVVEGETGVIVIDPLISVETAAAALGLYRAHRGERPVTGVIYTHSHVDHFGGVKGVTSQEEVDAEAPAEMHFLCPDRRALCIAENATHTLHNLLTIRGALVRDPHAWARYLNEAIEMFGDRRRTDTRR